MFWWFWWFPIIFRRSPQFFSLISIRFPTICAMYILSFSCRCHQISYGFLQVPIPLPSLQKRCFRESSKRRHASPRHSTHQAVRHATLRTTPRPRRVTPRPLDFDVFGGFWWFWFPCCGGFVGLGILYQFLSFASDLLVFVDDFGGFGWVCLFLWFWWFLVGSPWGTPYHSL